MSSESQSISTPEADKVGSLRPYVKPEIRRVDLAIEETLSSGCKLWAVESPCGEDDFSATLENGS